MTFHASEMSVFLFYDWLSLKTWDATLRCCVAHNTEIRFMHLKFEIAFSDSGYLYANNKMLLSNLPALCVLPCQLWQKYVSVISHCTKKYFLIHTQLSI